MNKQILVVAAHPDDEILGCGGTLAKHAAAGDKVRILFVADGVSARGTPGHDAANARRKAAAAKAASAIGAEAPAFLDLPDQRLDCLEFLDIVQAIERASADLKPQIVYTHFSGDLNLDHRIVSRATMTAFRPLPASSVTRIACFETPSATGWSAPEIQATFMPNLFVDIDDYWPAKQRALQAYAEEMRPWPHARSMQALEHLAGWRGASVGHTKAEAFMLMRDLA